MAATTGAWASASGFSSTGASATWTSAPCFASSAPSPFTPAPRRATWSLPPVRWARARPAATAWRVALRRAPACCSATTRTLDMVSFSVFRAGALQDLRLFVELLPELLDVGDLHAALARRRRLEPLHDHLRGEVHAEGGGGELLHLLLLGLHDPGERREARLVEPEVGRHHRGERHLDRLDAAVDLADHRERL